MYDDTGGPCDLQPVARGQLRRRYYNDEQVVAVTRVRLSSQQHTVARYGDSLVTPAVACPLWSGDRGVILPAIPRPYPRGSPPIGHAPSPPRRWASTHEHVRHRRGEVQRHVGRSVRPRRHDGRRSADPQSGVQSAARDQRGRGHHPHQPPCVPHRAAPVDGSHAGRWHRDRRGTVRHQPGRRLPTPRRSRRTGTSTTRPTRSSRACPCSRTTTATSSRPDAGSLQVRHRHARVGHPDRNPRGACSLCDGCRRTRALDPQRPDGGRSRQGNTCSSSRGGPDRTLVQQALVAGRVPEGAPTLTITGPAGGGRCLPWPPRTTASYLLCEQGVGTPGDRQAGRRAPVRSQLEATYPPGQPHGHRSNSRWRVLA